jgi:PAS domain S-box-containing protein
MKTDDGIYKAFPDNVYDGVCFVDKDRRITYRSKGAERITGHAAAEVVGKHCSVDILMHVVPVDDVLEIINVDRNGAEPPAGIPARLSR